MLFKQELLMNIPICMSLYVVRVVYYYRERDHDENNIILWRESKTQKVGIIGKTDIWNIFYILCDFNGKC